MEPKDSTQQPKRTQRGHKKQKQRKISDKDRKAAKTRTKNNIKKKKGKIQEKNKVRGNKRHRKTNKELPARIQSNNYKTKTTKPKLPKAYLRRTQKGYCIYTLKNKGSAWIIEKSTRQ